jgi:hypothetical protein
MADGAEEGLSYDCGVGKLDANEQAVAPHDLATAPCVAALSQKQQEMFGQLEAVLKLKSCAGIRDINDRTAMRLRVAFNNDDGVIVELPARTFPQFGSAAKIADNDHHKNSCMGR